MFNELSISKTNLYDREAIGSNGPILKGAQEAPEIRFKLKSGYSGSYRCISVNAF